jgi:hypothetical protein
MLREYNKEMSFIKVERRRFFVVLFSDCYLFEERGKEGGEGHRRELVKNRRESND